MAAEIRIYDPPEEGAPAFRGIGLLTAASAVTLVERLYRPGYFTIEVPWGARHAEKLAVGRLVRVRGAGWKGRSSPFWGIVDSLSLSVTAAGAVLTVSGRQLKGLAQDRITIPPDFTGVTGAQGYDPASGSTEHCMKHFVQANMKDPAQPGRALYGLEIAPDLGRGLAQDKYMSRHEALSEVLAALGEAAELGWDIVPDLDRHRFTFDVIPGEDHTAGQSQRKRVILDVRRKTALAQHYQYSVEDSRNLFYTTMSGSEFADEALTVTYLREGETEPAGIRRREVHLTVSVNAPAAGEEYDELKRSALIEAEKYRPAESFTVELGPGPYVYREDFSLGDRVTVRNQDWGITMDARLTEMETRCSVEGASLTATFGTAPLNVFGQLRRQIKTGG